MEILINPAWFESLPTVALLVIGGVSMYAVIKGADWLVEGASGIALMLGMSKVIVGATIVSLGTTSPECAVSVFAAYQGNAGLALGNAVGSIIADTALIFGVGCMMMALPVDRFLLNRQGWVQFGSAVLLAGLCYGVWLASDDAGGAVLGRWVGGLLLALLVVYMVLSVRWGRQHSHATAEHVRHEPDEIIEEARKLPVGKLALMFVGGLVLVLLFAQLLITNVEIVARRWGVPDVVIASTIVAFGTSLPELVVGITAVRKGHASLLIGNVIGADVLNVLFVVGAAAAAAPLPVITPAASIPQIFLVLHLPTMLVVLLMFRVYIFGAIRAGRFSRWMGVPLVAIYLAYLALNATLGSGGH